MFSKKESGEHASEVSSSARSEHGTPSSTPTPRPGGPTATIGPSIRIDGDLQGEEDLVVEGRVTGTVKLKKNTLTIGTQGQVEARVYAHTILVDGTVNGDLYASERISIRASARIEGNIYAPRISLEDGARFRGAIDMDTETEAFRKAFGASKSAPAPSASSTQSTKNGKSGSGASNAPQSGASSSSNAA